MRIADIPEIDNLSTPEKILLVEDIWDSIPADESKVPVPECHIEELEKRHKRYLNDPGNLLTLKELQARIKARK